jgi:hypothetical protein
MSGLPVFETRPSENDGTKASHNYYLLIRWEYIVVLSTPVVLIGLMVWWEFVETTLGPHEAIETLAGVTIITPFFLLLIGWIPLVVQAITIQNQTDVDDRTTYVAHTIALALISPMTAFTTVFFVVFAFWR